MKAETQNEYLKSQQKSTIKSPIIIVVFFSRFNVMCFSRSLVRNTFKAIKLVILKEELLLTRPNLFFHNYNENAYNLIYSECIVPRIMYLKQMQK